MNKFVIIFSLRGSSKLLHSRDQKKANCNQAQRPCPHQQEEVQVLYRPYHCSREGDVVNHRGGQRRHPEH